MRRSWDDPKDSGQREVRLAGCCRRGWGDLECGGRVGGFCEQGDDGLLYNSAAVVDGSRILGVYRKTHLWDREKLFFQPGAQAPRVFDTPAGRSASWSPTTSSSLN
jgi:predicted amidohydrolase